MTDYQLLVAFLGGVSITLGADLYILKQAYAINQRVRTTGSHSGWFDFIVFIVWRTGMQIDLLFLLLGLIPIVYMLDDTLGLIYSWGLSALFLAHAVKSWRTQVDDVFTKLNEFQQQEEAKKPDNATPASSSSSPSPNCTGHTE